jgi:hypothetical protein
MQKLQIPKERPVAGCAIFAFSPVIDNIITYQFLRLKGGEVNAKNSSIELFKNCLQQTILYLN